MVDDVRSIRTHPQYYIPEGNVCFLVQDTRFRLHKHFFSRESKFFQKLFAEGGDDDGTTAPPQYKLPVTVDEFATLCYIWYRREYSYAGIPGKDEWITVLQLAKKWGFNEVGHLAVDQLHKIKMRPAERVCLYRKYGVNEQLLIPSYMALCKSQTLPSLQEAEELTIGIVLKIAAVREKAILTGAASRTQRSVGIPDDALIQIIKEIFQIAPRSNGKIAQIIAKLLHVTPYSDDKNVRAGGSNDNYNGDSNTLGDLAQNNQS